MALCMVHFIFPIQRESILRGKCGYLNFKIICCYPLNGIIFLITDNIDVLSDNLTDMLNYFMCTVKDCNGSIGDNLVGLVK